MFYKNFIRLSILALSLTLSLVPQNTFAFGAYDNPTNVDIKSASTFIVFSKTGISTDGQTTFAGNIGVSPAAAASITGVTCANMTIGRMYTITPPLGPNGCVTTSATASDDNQLLTQARNDFDAAYTDGRSQTTHPFDETSGAANLGANGPKGRGIYNYTGAAAIDSNLIIRGNSTDIWIFQINAAKTQAANTKVILQNEAGVVDGAYGPQPKNIFWIINGSSSQSIGSKFVGTSIINGALTTAEQSSYIGRAYTNATVSATSTSFAIPADVPPPPPGEPPVDLATINATIKDTVLPFYHTMAIVSSGLLLYLAYRLIIHPWYRNKS